MKRTICALLSALFLSVAAIPCAATDSAAAPSPGSDPAVFSDVLPGDWCYDAVMLCRETGILSGTTATTFDPQGTLTIPQMVVILDRVWNLQKHGTAEVPPLPADPRDYVRFYDGDIQVANFRNLQAHGSHGSQLLFWFDAEDPAVGQPTLRLEIGEAGQPPEVTVTGTQITDPALDDRYPDTSAEETVVYAFDLEDAWDLSEHLMWYHTFTVTQWDTWEEQGVLDAWYFPALYDLLISEDGLDDFLPTEHLMDETAAPQDPAFREDLAAMIWSIAPDLPAINQHTAIPDMPQADYTGTPYEALPGAVLELYNAGIVTGVDDPGNFAPKSPLTRAQASVIFARLLDPALRISF